MTVDLETRQRWDAEDARCFFRALGKPEPCDFRPDGQHDPAHLIPAQRLRNAGVPDKDWRVIIPACRRHHHLFDAGVPALRLSENEYPASVHEFAREHGFYFAGDRGWRHAVAEVTE